MPGLGVKWHIHHRVIPNPLPAFFCYPHAIHGLLYLDSVDTDSGPICILPGSHLKHNLNVDSKSNFDIEGQLIIPVKAGTCLLMHANLWHKTMPTTDMATKRRVILFGYTPSWIKSDITRGAKTGLNFIDKLRNNSNNETRELLGEFYW